MNRQLYCVTGLLLFCVFSFTNSKQVYSKIQPESTLTQSSLIKLGEIPGPATGFAIQGDYAYVLTGRYGNSDMKIVDISDASNPQVVGSWSCLGLVWTCDPDQIGADALWSIEVSGQYAYIRGWYGIYIVDISNHNNPQLVQSYFPDLSYPVWLRKYGDKVYTQTTKPG